MSFRRPSVNWCYLRWLIELNLRKQPAFGPQVSLEGKLDHCGGLFHDNYVFDAGENRFVLRLAKSRDALRSQPEAAASLEREAETLRRLAGTELPFFVPEFICEVCEESGERIGFIETWLRGVPLSAYGVFRLCSTIWRSSRGAPGGHSSKRMRSSGWCRPTTNCAERICG